MPVGKDQAAHLELAREIVRAFNDRYGETFPEPQAVFTDAPVVLGHGRRQEDVQVDRATPSTSSRRARADPAAGHVRWSPTRSGSCGRTRAGRRSATSASSTAFFGDDYEEIWEGERTARTGCVDTKKLLAERMLASFAEARERRRELESRPGYVEEVLRAGADRLAPLAAETMRICHDVMGLAPR